MNDLKNKIANLSDNDKKTILTEYAELERTGSTGDTLLRRIAEEMQTKQTAPIGLGLIQVAQETALQVAFEHYNLPR